MRYVYVSNKGSKPMNIGMNKAKRIARRADKIDTAIVRRELGPEMPQQRMNYKLLVFHRHRYYHDQHEEFVRGQQAAS